MSLDSESNDICTGIQNMVTQEIKWEENKRQAHYLALQNQINPHFLYNTLEAIRSESLKAGLNTVADMSESLANYFRYTISQTSDFVTLAEEIQNVRDYFSIQKFRFGERLSLDIQIPETDDFQMYHMPKLILQPIVENSLIHGLESKLSGGLIKITAMFSDKRLCIYIEDNGVGITSDSLIELNRRLASDEDPGEDGEKDDYRDGFRALKELGYPGFISFECGCEGDRKEVLTNAVQLLRQQWEEA